MPGEVAQATQFHLQSILQILEDKSIRTHYQKTEARVLCLLAVWGREGPLSDGRMMSNVKRKQAYGAFHKQGGPLGPRGAGSGGGSGKSVLVFTLSSPGIPPSLIPISLQCHIPINSP